MLAKNYIFDPTMGRIRLNKTDQQGLILKEGLVDYSPDFQTF